MKKVNYNDPNQMYEVTFTHIYHTAGFDISNEMAGVKTYTPPLKRHACLEHGYWCWSNAWENPSLAVKFVFYKLRKWMNCI